MLDKNERKRREKNPNAAISEASNPFEYMNRMEKMRAKNPLQDFSLFYRGWKTTLMAYSATEAIEGFASLLYPWVNVNRNLVEVNSIGRVTK